MPDVSSSSLQEFDALCDALFDGAATAAQVARLEELATASPALRRRYVELADQEAALAWDGGEPAATSVEPAAAASPRDWPRAVRTFALGGAGAFAVAASLGLAVWLTLRSAERGANEPDESVSAAIWTAGAGAEWFGGTSPRLGDPIVPHREQALLTGWAELRFASGAEAILEGPAVFEVAAADRLILRAGRCSVHAPDGAAGFRVETPDGEVVDLGTRFVVRVPEVDGAPAEAGAGGGTEVHVVEGAAELHPAPSHFPRPADRLTTGQARRLTGSADRPAEPLSFDASQYRGSLPDRVVSYKTRDAADGLTTLLSLTVQRAGRTRTYAAGELTPAAVTSLSAPAGNYTYAVPVGATGPLADWLDRPFALNAGRINPGGASEPLTADPVLTGPDRTPGLAVRFDPPAINGPGPDLVLFDLQSVVDVPAGDAFHLSPVTFRRGLRSITVERFDLTVGDAGASRVAPFALPRLDPDARDLGAGETARVTLDPAGPRLVPALRFTANAVAVDLSALGYGPDEAVDALFVRDARDDAKYLDPTLIVGLPADVESQNELPKETP